MEQIKESRKPAIKESSAICAKCGHSHDPAIVKAKYEAREESFTSFFCHACNAYNRIRYTKKGLVRLAGPRVRLIVRPIIKADRMNCPHCDHLIDREDFDFLLKTKTYRRSTCQSCYGPLIVRRTTLGFYTTSKADVKRKQENKEKGISRLEFDPVEKKFKSIKENYYLWQKWKKQKNS
jgi:RNase P subunit RPR2